jgi:hypothetical protein
MARDRMAELRTELNRLVSMIVASIFSKCLLSTAFTL